MFLGFKRPVNLTRCPLLDDSNAEDVQLCKFRQCYDNVPREGRHRASLFSFRVCVCVCVCVCVKRVTRCGPPGNSLPRRPTVVSRVIFVGVRFPKVLRFTAWLCSYAGGSCK